MLLRGRLRRGVAGAFRRPLRGARRMPAHSGGSWRRRCHSARGGWHAARTPPRTPGTRSCMPRASREAPPRPAASGGPRRGPWQCRHRHSQGTTGCTGASAPRPVRQYRHPRRSCRRSHTRRRPRCSGRRARGRRRAGDGFRAAAERSLPLLSSALGWDDNAGLPLDRLEQRADGGSEATVGGRRDGELQLTRSRSKDVAHSASRPVGSVRPPAASPHEGESKSRSAGRPCSDPDRIHIALVM
jgi:hypothetical protein